MALSYCYQSGCSECPLKPAAAERFLQQSHNFGNCCSPGTGQHNPPGLFPVVMQNIGQQQDFNQKKFSIHYTKRKKNCLAQSRHQREKVLVKPELREESGWRDQSRLFADRAAAGRLLAQKLLDFQGGDGLVLAIPAGGVPVAAEIARTLRLPLEPLIVRKVQIPWNTEAGFGALAPDGQVLLNEPLVQALGLTPTQIEAQVAATRRNLIQREELFRGGRPYPKVTGRTLIVADDGLASGYTMLAALKFLIRQQPKDVVVAVPTGLLDTIKAVMAATGATVVCLNVCTRRPFAVAAAYRRWYDVADAEVMQILKEFGRQEGPPADV